MVGSAMTAADRPDDLDDAERALVDAIGGLATGPTLSSPDRPLAAGSSLTGRRLETLFDAQLASRALDHTARWLRAQGVGFYTIGSSGHEANALVAAALRPTDPALLHYRSGAFYLARAAQVAGHDGLEDVLLGLLAARDEPIAGGRHKTFGHADLAVIPQTSTIASHLPRAVGVAFAIGRSPRAGVPTHWPADAVAVCSFGDASVNHSTAQGALNTAAWMQHGSWPLPLLLVCEDNGWGISVPTPAGWIARTLSGRGLRYERVEGTDPVAVFDAAEDLVEHARVQRQPAILHLQTVRYGGHAGTDVESAYRDAASRRADREADPLVATARVLVANGLATPTELARRVLLTRRAVRSRALELMPRPRLASAAEVIAPLAPRRPDAVAEEAGALAVRETPVLALTVAESINHSLGELLEADDRVLVFGEDVGVKGGVYGVTRGLQRAAGEAHVFDTLLDEQSILGIALGAAVSGYVPIPEIQYLAYVHNAIDQLRGEAATLSFFSQHAFRNGMVVRIAAYAYQKGFGGHFHNDDALGGLRDLPGVVVASPATGADAAAIMRTCAAAAAVDGTVSVFLEPIALYHTRDLHEPGDGGWLSVPGDDHVPIGAGRVVRDGGDVLVVSWANGLYMSLRVAERLARHGISCRVFDVRWLVPLPLDEIAEHARTVGRVVVVDETRHTGGVGEAIITGLVESGLTVPIRRVASADSYVPLGEAASLVLVSEDDITDAVRAIVRAPRPDERADPDDRWVPA
jgi:2-oxoisovalerate dehydrogenase E1 component